MDFNDAETGEFVFHLTHILTLEVELFDLDLSSRDLMFKFDFVLFHRSLILKC